MQLAVGYAGRQAGRWHGIDGIEACKLFLLILLSSIGAYMQSELLHNTVHLALHAVCLSLSLLVGDVLQASTNCCAACYVCGSSKVGEFKIYTLVMGPTGPSGKGRAGGQGQGRQARAGKGRRGRAGWKCRRERAGREG